MKRIFFVSVVCILVVLCFIAGCAGIMVRKEEQPTPQMVKELRALLDSVDYELYKKERDVFDCSNKTALLYDTLTLKKYECAIIIGKESLFAKEVHAWLIARKYGKKFEHTKMRYLGRSEDLTSPIMY